MKKKVKTIEVKTIEEMGELISPNIYPRTIYLSSSFIREKLKRFKTIPSLTNLLCPFCKIDVLKIIEVWPQCSAPVAGYGSHLFHRYQCVCSNEACNGKFVGDL